MEDNMKTKTQLIAELEKIRKRIGVLEKTEIEHNILENRISERTKELNQANNLFLAITEGTDDIIFVKDIHGRYQLINFSTRQVLNLRLSGEKL